MEHDGQRRISLMIREDQYQKILAADINVSGLIRDLIDDHFGEHSVTITLTQETRALYNKIVSSTGGGDTEIEPYLKTALKMMLKDKIREMERLQKSLEKQKL
jgi:Na+-transporting NADH:ubiquinone oxidoreductase subunit NqrA